MSEDYIPLYGLKCGPPEYAGGLFESAPFAEYSPEGPQYVGMNAPTPPEPIYELNTDNCGCPIWVSAAEVVYGHNLENQVQRIGLLPDFVEFTISLALEGLSWYERINDGPMTGAFGLTEFSGMG